MKKTHISHALQFVAGLALAAGSTLVAAQAWPTKTVTFVNPFPAGGGTDTFARPIAARLSADAATMA